MARVTWRRTSRKKGCGPWPATCNRNRATAKTPAARARGKTIELDFGRAWLTEHPLTEADLETATTYLAATDYKLRYR